MTVANVNVTKVLFKRGNTVQNSNYTGVSGEISIDTQTKTLRVHDGITPGGNILTTGGIYGNSNVTTYLTSVAGNIIPSANVTYSLGNATNQWRDLWVSNNTIYIGNVPITVSNGSLLINGNSVTGGTGTDDVLRANVGAFQIYANANAATQTISINSINANVTAANSAIQTLSANIGTLVSGAPAALDTLLELGNALGNSDSFSSTMVNWLGNITSNVTAANTSINTINANVGAYQIYANANAATQSTSIDSINSNVTAANSSINTFNANLGAFQTYANLHFLDSSYSNTNVSAYLSTITSGNVGAGNLTVINNFSSNVITANSFIYANGVNILNGIGGTYSNTNVEAYIGGNIGAYQIYANANLGTATTNITTLFSNAATQATAINTINANLGTATTNITTLFSNAATQAASIDTINANVGAYQTFANANAATQANSIDTVNANIGAFQTYANATFSTSTYSNTTANALLSSNTVSTISTTGNIVTIANVIATTFRFANGVNILSTITAVANLSSLTGNISWTAVGANPPTFTTASNGTKIVLWPSISSTMVDYAIGVEAGNTWFSIPQAANNFGYKWYAGNTTIATLSGNGTLTTGNITTTGNISATNFVGNGVGLTNVTVSAAGNIVGTSSNVTLVAGNYSYTFDNTGNVTLPANVFVGVTNTFLPNTVASFSSNVNYYSQVTLQNKSSGNDATADYIVTANNGSDTVNFLDLGIINSGYDNTTPSNSLGNIVFAADSYIYAQGNTSNANQSGGNLAIGTSTTGKAIKFFAGGTTSSAIAMTVANTGVTVGGNITATGTLSGSGSGLTGVALKTTGSWTVTAGTGTYSFTVPASGTYQLWVDCNIPNGILVWNATATVTNTNVPVVGAQYAWVYNGGGSPIDFTSIPNQFTGTGNTIVRSNTAPSATTNRFDFGFNNTSGGNVTVRYGWVAIS